MNRAFVFAFVLVATGAPMAAEAEAPNGVGPVLDCSTPVLAADTPEKTKLLRVRYDADAIARQLPQTYASRLAGRFWTQAEGEESGLVLRPTGDEPVDNEKMTLCGELSTVEFVAGHTHVKEELQRLRGPTSKLRSGRPSQGLARHCGSR